MQIRDLLPAVSCRMMRLAVAAILFGLLANAASHAASIRGVVTDATGAKVTGASVSLVSSGKVVASSVSSSDGSFQLTTGSAGRFFLVVTARSFRQLQTPDFYAGQLDSIHHKGRRPGCKEHSQRDAYHPARCKSFCAAAAAGTV